MAVPEHIRKVARPVNTVVVDSGLDTPHRYAVLERAKSKYIPGRNPQPRNGAVIGHIIDGVYVEKTKKGAAEAAARQKMLSYGSSALVKSISADLLADLLQIYDCKDACSIMAIASARVICPKITTASFAAHYKRTFLSVFYPGIGITGPTVTKLFFRLGQNEAGRMAFYARRWEAVAKEHHVAIDGSLLQDDIHVNDLEYYSRKAQDNKTNDISVLYAYDIETLEPVCTQAFPGSCLNAQTYTEFLQDNTLPKGILVLDKGFSPRTLREELRNHPSLQYLHPLKKDDSRIKKYTLLDFEGIIPGVEGPIPYCKRELKNGVCLYAFRDIRRAGEAESQFIAAAKEHGNFSYEKYQEERKFFGVSVFESDGNLDAKTIYDCYARRSFIEMAFSKYKSAEYSDRSGAQKTFIVMGSELISFISTVITCRIARKMEEAGLLNDASYGDIMEDLSVAWRKVDAPENPVSTDGGWVHTQESSLKAMEALGLSKPEEEKPAKRPRGRPRTKPVVVGPKRPPGRPRKNEQPEEEKPKRPRGRPRKSEQPEEEKPKRPRGRPKKEQPAN